MSDEQSNSAEETKKTVVEGQVPDGFGDESLFFGGGYEDITSADQRIDDTGKTTEQILAEAGVTMEEINKTFPPNYEPLQKDPSKMSTEELLKRMKASQERQKNKKAYSDETADMPSIDEINRMNSERASGKIGFGAEGPLFELDGFLKLLERSKEDARRKKESELEQKIRQSIYTDMKNSLESIVESSELEEFDAKAARRLFLDKAKEQSSLQHFLKTIRQYAKKGHSEMRVHYICQYDWTKLSELGFKITNLSAGGNLEYKISWYSRE